MCYVSLCCNQIRTRICMAKSSSNGAIFNKIRVHLGLKYTCKLHNCINNFTTLALLNGTSDFYVHTKSTLVREFGSYKKMKWNCRIMITWQCEDWEIAFKSIGNHFIGFPVRNKVCLFYT